jgi:hypothetical protein
VDVRAAEARAREQRSSRGGFGSRLSANSMMFRASFQGSTTSSARRGAAETTDSDAATVMAQGAPFIHTKVEAGATQRRFDAQRKTGGGGRPVLMASQQMERTAELQNPEVRAELNRHIRECERKCFASSRLGSIPQASARARQQATREQVKGQWCESSTGTVCRRCDRAWRSCRRLRGCAGRVSKAHVREQRKFSP